ncbi:MAG: DNA adenine methylase [Gammaproteobacteria bacterium]|nr:DNA adenine methylase [Gammaproteobacteria bacterium]
MTAPAATTLQTGLAGRPRRLAFPYYGGKFSKLKYILPQFGTPHRTFVELFCGSAAVTLNKPPVEREVINDLAGEVADFWTAVRERPDELQRAVNCTPGGGAEFKRCLDAPPSDCVVERARRFYVRVSHAFSSIPSSRGSGFYAGCRFPKLRAGLPGVCERMRAVVVENTDAVRLMRRVMNATEQGKRLCPVLFYADPPYMGRRSEGEYLVEGFDHETFLHAVLDASALPWVKLCISGYASELYDSLLIGWRRVEFDCKLHAPNRGSMQRRTEVVWRNYGLEDGR